MNFDILSISSYIGIAAFALSGFFLATKKRLDVVGVFIIALITSNGGGVLRDTLMGNMSKILIEPRIFIDVILVLAIAMIFRLQHSSNIEQRMIFIVSDALGLVAFSITGSLIAITSGFSFFGVMVIAFLNANGGGLIRDILLNELPLLLYGNFYASISLLVAIILYILEAYQMLNNYTIMIVFVLGVIIRLLAHYKKWKLPLLS